MIRTSGSDPVFDHKKEIKSKLLSGLASVIQFESGFYFVSKSRFVGQKLRADSSACNKFFKLKPY